MFKADPEHQCCALRMVRRATGNSATVIGRYLYHSLDQRRVGRRKSIAVKANIVFQTRPAVTA